MAHDVFISYSSQDKAVADALCARLEGDKIRCWIAPRDVLAGIPYAEALIDALVASRMMVLILSGKSNESRHVVREVESAVSRGIPIIPFRIEDVQPSKSLDYYLKSIHWLDALTPPLERHLETLSQTVQKVLEREPASGQGDQTSTNAAMDQSAAVTRQQPQRRINVAAMIGGIAALVLVSGLILWAAFGGGGSKPGTNVTEVKTPPDSKSTANEPAKSGLVDEKKRETETSAEKTSPSAEKKGPPEEKAPQTPPTPQTPEEAIRELITRHYELICKKDLEGVLSTFRAGDGPNLQALRRDSFQKTVSVTGKTELKQLTIENIKIEGEFAQARVTVLLSAARVDTRDPYYSDEPMIFDFKLIQEGTEWRIKGWDFPNYAKLAAKTDPDDIANLIRWHFEQYRRRDFAAILATLSKGFDAAELDRRRTAFKLVTDHAANVEIKRLDISNVKVDGEIGSARATVVLAGTDLRNGGPFFPTEPFVYNFGFVKEDGWKISRLFIAMMSEFRPFVSAEGRFKCSLPGTPLETTVEWTPGVTGHLLTVLASGKKFMISYADFPAESIEGKGPQKILKDFADDLHKGLVREKESEVSVGEAKTPGLEFQFEPSKGVFIRERLMLSGLRLYFIQVVSPDDKEFLSTKDGSRLFDTFEVTDKLSRPAPAGGGPKPDADQFVSEDGKFKASFPHKPDYRTEELSGGIKRYEYSAIGGGKRFVISYMDFDEADVKDKDPQPRLAAFAAGYRKGAKLEGEKEVLLGKDKIPARAYSLETGDKVFIRERLALSGRRLYIQFIAVQDNKDLLTTPAADKFFEAFEITK